MLPFCDWLLIGSNPRRSRRWADSCFNPFGGGSCVAHNGRWSPSSSPFLPMAEWLNPSHLFRLSATDGRGSFYFDLAFFVSLRIIITFVSIGQGAGKKKSSPASFILSSIQTSLRKRGEDTCLSKQITGDCYTRAELAFDNQRLTWANDRFQLVIHWNIDRRSNTNRLSLCLLHCHN